MTSRPKGQFLSFPGSGVQFDVVITGYSMSTSAARAANGIRLQIRVHVSPVLGDCKWWRLSKFVSPLPSFLYLRNISLSTGDLLSANSPLEYQWMQDAQYLRVLALKKMRKWRCTLSRLDGHGRVWFSSITATNTPRDSQQGMCFMYFQIFCRQHIFHPDQLLSRTVHITRNSTKEGLFREAFLSHR